MDGRAWLGYSPLGCKESDITSLTHGMTEGGCQRAGGHFTGLHCAVASCVNGVVAMPLQLSTSYESSSSETPELHGNTI